jgi:hypothetical protein
LLRAGDIELRPEQRQQRLAILGLPSRSEVTEQGKGLGASQCNSLSVVRNARRAEEKYASHPHQRAAAAQCARTVAGLSTDIMMLVL